jgi:hypothetical protein
METQVKVFCKNKCGFEDQFEPCEFGLTYFQAEGRCPNCDGDTVYEDGTPTAEVMGFKLTDDYKEYLTLSTLDFRDAAQENRFKELQVKFPL